MSEKQVVVDVVKAAQDLLASKGILPERTAVPGEALPVILQHGDNLLQLDAEEVRCQFGHPNPARGKFCPECGLKVGVEVMDMAAVLSPPKSADLLTPEERAAREIAHQQAIAANVMFDQQAAPDFQPSSGQRITIHFVDDGFTALGHVWLRGQQIDIGPDHPRWEDALRWIQRSPDEQINTYGKQYFAEGPVPRDESAYEQFRQVEVRRSLGRRPLSNVPDTALLGTA